MASRSAKRPLNVLRPAGKKLRVLFVAATPTDTARMAVGEEYRQVDASVRSSPGAARFEFHFAHEVRAAELGPALLRFQPHIVHFSGHGSREGELMLPDASGQAAPAQAEKVAQLFDAVGRGLAIRCVVLNACYSEGLAKALTAHVDCVIGVPAALRDKVAVAFAGAFYQAIGFGHDLDAAYRYACAQVDLSVPARSALPTIHCREGVHSKDLQFLEAERVSMVEEQEPPGPAGWKSWLVLPALISVFVVAMWWPKGHPGVRPDALDASPASRVNGVTASPPADAAAGAWPDARSHDDAPVAMDVQAVRDAPTYRRSHTSFSDRPDAPGADASDSAPQRDVMPLESILPPPPAQLRNAGSIGDPTSDAFKP